MATKPTDPTLKPIHVYVPAPLRQKLKIRAAQRGVSMAALVTQALTKELR